MKTLLLALLAPLALAATACSNATVGSNEVNPQAVNEEYTVTYSATQNQMSLWAQFRVGNQTGTTVKLVSPAQLTVNGQQVSSTWNILEGTYYQDNFAAGFMTSSTVVYTDANGNAHTYPAHLNPITYTATATVSASTPYVVQLQGAALASTENLSATITQTVSSGAGPQPIYGQYNPVNNTVVFQVSDLKTLNPGPAQIDITRNGGYSFSTGFFQTVYDAGTQNLNITP
jgi:hypothetical protein